MMVAIGREVVAMNNNTLTWVDNSRFSLRCLLTWGGEGVAPLVVVDGLPVPLAPDDCGG